MQLRNTRGGGGWPAWWTLCLLLAASLALPWQARAEPVLAATSLPAARGADGMQLALSRSGSADARLSATLRQRGHPDVPLLRDHERAKGMNLLPLPLAADAEGVLALAVQQAAGTVVARWDSDLAKSRGDASFAWESVFTSPGFDEGARIGMGGARHMVAWDDGNGPALYVGGGFVTAGARRCASAGAARHRRAPGSAPAAARAGAGVSPAWQRADPAVRAAAVTARREP